MPCSHTTLEEDRRKFAQYQIALFDALRSNPMDGDAALSYLICDPGGSADRPYNFLALHKHVFPRKSARAGRAFWA
jgi:hypothetical protein